MSNRIKLQLRKFTKKEIEALDAPKSAPKPKIDWKKELTINLKGGIWCGLFTFVMLAKLIAVCFFDSKDYTSGVLTVYGTVIGTYGITRMGSKFVNGKNGKEVSED